MSKVLIADKADALNFQVKGALTSINATRTDLPFYKDGTARIKLA